MVFRCSNKILPIKFFDMSTRVSQKNLIFEFDHGVEFERTYGQYERNEKKLGILMHLLQSAARFCDFSTRL